jgi:hypothetical protein
MSPQRRRGICGKAPGRRRASAGAIRSPDSGLAEHAIHFWNGAKGTTVRYNKIFHSDRGIGFGLGKKGHTGGVIANNFVHVSRDVGISLESSPNTRVVHNSVFVAGNYPNAIEYRFKSTKHAFVTANLTNAAITSRDGGDAVVGGNIDYAQADWFTNSATGDLHITAPVPNAVKAQLTSPDVPFDIDCEPRNGGRTDVGADHSDLQPNESR